MSLNIVLAPGVLGFGKLAGFEYFRGVPGRLHGLGHKVLLATTNPIGRVKDRAPRLADQIRDALSEGKLDPAQPIHILAHSMGGLDARFLIAKNLLGPKTRISTLIAIATPHLGSPIASLLNMANPFHILTAIPSLDKGFLRELHDRADAVGDLSEEASAQFNKDCPDDPRVKYREVVGIGRKGFLSTSKFFVPLSLFVTAKVGPNDGVVPLKSATRGFTKTPIAEWPGDHADMIGYNLDDPTGPPTFPHLEKYEELVQKIPTL